MSDLLTVALTSFMIALSGVLTPGPLLFVTISQASRRGLSAGIIVALGHGLVELATVIFLAFGVGQFLSRPSFLGAIGILGGIVLAWMGWGMVREAWLGKADLTLEVQSGSRFGPLGSGIVATLGNPYWLMWWATIGVNYVALTQTRGWLNLGVFYTGHVAADFLWLGLVSAMIASGQRLITNRLYTNITLILGLFLLGMAGYFLYSGIGFLTA